MDLKSFNYFINMPHLRLGEARMKEEQEGNLEETLVISVIAVLAIFFRFIVESDLSLTLIVFILIFLTIIITESVVKPLLHMKEAEPVQKETIQHSGREFPSKDMKKVYMGALFAFVVLVTFFVWAHSFTHTGPLEHIYQYAEHVLMGGTALIFLWIVYARRKREVIVGQKP